MAPHLNVTVVRVAEFLLGQRHERTAIHSVQQFLSLQRNPGNIYSPEPFLDFSFSTLTDIDEEFCLQHLLALISGDAANALGYAVRVDDAQLALNEPAQGGDALLSPHIDHHQLY